MDDFRDATQEFGPVFEEISATIIQGEWANVHCMAGIHRAATIAIPMRAAIHGETVAQAKLAIVGVRAVELEKASSYYVRDNWNGGNVQGWLEDMATKARFIWATAKMRQGMIKLGITSTGNMIHGVRMPEDGRAMPMCQYRQTGSSEKARFGDGSTITTAHGKGAAVEATTWTMVKGHIKLCPKCSKYLSPGMQTALENGGIA
jgi:hypothetical protein